MKLLPLSQGLFSEVDDDVFDWASKHRWTAQKRKHTFHVARYDNGVYVYLHRKITGALPGEEVNHINGDGLRNVRTNLQRTDKAGNMQGFQTPRLHKTSRFRGVFFENYTKKWRASIMCRGVTRRLGRFANEEDAARAYNAAAKELFGSYAQLNPV